MIHIYIYNVKWPRLSPRWHWWWRCVFDVFHWTPLWNMADISWFAGGYLNLDSITSSLGLRLCMRWLLWWPLVLSDSQDKRHVHNYLHNSMIIFNICPCLYRHATYIVIYIIYTLSNIQYIEKVITSRSQDIIPNSNSASKFCISCQLQYDANLPEVCWCRCHALLLAIDTATSPNRWSFRCSIFPAQTRSLVVKRRIASTTWNWL